MPRANRHFLPGHVWHITHRCHQKKFLKNLSLHYRQLHFSCGIDALKESRRNTLTLSPRDPLVSLWLLVPLACRFYFGPDSRFAHGRIPGKLCRGRYGSRGGRFVSLSGPGRFSIHTVRISQAFFN